MKGFEKVEFIFFSTAGTSTRVQSALTVAKRGSMEAPDLINNRYSMSRGPVKQQQQFGSEIQSNNSNNTNNINVKHFGAGGHSHAMPRPAYSPSPISGHKRDSSGFDVGRGSSPEVSEQKRKRIKADVEPARLTSPSAMLRTPPEHANVLIGDQVAARVTPENADKDDWIVVKVIRFDREANKYEVIDEEPGDDEESGQRKYKLPPSCIIPFPKRTDRSAASDFPTGSQVLAVYPGTTALYKAAVVASHRKRKNDDYLLEFDDDEEDGFDGLPKRVVPFYHVVQLPEGHRQ